MVLRTGEAGVFRERACQRRGLACQGEAARGMWRPREFAGGCAPPREPPGRATAVWEATPEIRDEMRLGERSPNRVPRGFKSRAGRHPPVEPAGRVEIRSFRRGRDAARQLLNAAARHREAPPSRRPARWSVWGSIGSEPHACEVRGSSSMAPAMSVDRCSKPGGAPAGGPGSSDKQSTESIARKDFRVVRPLIFRTPPTEDHHRGGADQGGRDPPTVAIATDAPASPPRVSRGCGRDPRPSRSQRYPSSLGQSGNESGVAPHVIAANAVGPQPGSGHVSRAI